MTPLLRKILGMSWLLTLCMFALLTVGVYTIESAARHLSGGGEYYADKQLVWIGLGSVVYFITALIDYKWIKYLALPMYLAGLVLMVVAMKFGNEVHQLSIPGGLKFQPAQLSIVAGIIMMAWVLQDLAKWHPLLSLPGAKVIAIGVLALIPFGLVAVMGDLGSAIVWLPVTAIVMLVSGVPFRYLTLMSLLGAAVLPVLFYILLPSFSERGAKRIDTYLDMLHDTNITRNDDNHGAYYASMAVGKAGYKGEGYKADVTSKSIHARRYIPFNTAHNDYVFAVFAEEQGFRGSLLLVLGFSLLLIQCIFIGYYGRDMSGQIIASAVVGLLFAHIFENIAMCVLLMPVTGIPLPFISYSGTFVVMCMFMLGLVQSVWVHRKDDDGEVEEEVKLSKRGKQFKLNRRRSDERVSPNTPTSRNA